MDIMRSQQRSLLLQEFDIVVPERVRDLAVFETGRLDFCFLPAPFTERLVCFVKLFDAATEQELLGGFTRVRLNRNAREPKWLSFSDFGFYDEEMRQPVDRCLFEVWAEGTGRVGVQLFG